MTPDHTIYVGDGSSDVHVMLHVNNRDGFTIAVSENRQLASIAKRTVLSDDAFSIVVPILDRSLAGAVGQSARCSLHGSDAARLGARPHRSCDRSATPRATPPGATPAVA